MAFNLTYRTINVPKELEHAANQYVMNGTTQPHTAKNRTLANMRSNRLCNN